MRLRVVTINVWNTEGASQRRMALLNRELRRLDPDLVAMQEVVQSAERNQLDELLDGLDLCRTHQAQTVAAPMPDAERYGGSAVATRWPHRIVETLDLRLLDAADVPWRALAVLVPLPGEGDVLFIGATTSWRLNAESARERQVVALSDLDARPRTALPTIIAGDFNATPDASSIRYLTGRQTLGGRSVCYHDAWAVAGQGPGDTWTVDNPNAATAIAQIVGQPRHRRRVDYVFVGSWDAHPMAHGRVVSAQLAFNQPDGDLWASDHFGVVADLDIGQGA
jgi:endonuclease/exonuclease/phosphatase family metal-dependent hydrolase